MKLITTSLIKNICLIRNIHASRANYSIMTSKSQGKSSNSSKRDAGDSLFDKLTPGKLEKSGSNKREATINTRTIIETKKVTSYKGKRLYEFTDDEKAEFVQMKIDEYHTELNPEVVEKYWNLFMECNSYAKLDKTLK